MRVSEVMNTDCETVKMSDSVRKAAECMRDKDIGMVLVEDQQGKVTGICTDRDIAIRCISHGGSADDKVEGCMTKDVISCSEDDDLETAADLMEREQVRRLMVCDANKRPVGVLAQADVARALGRSSLIGEMVNEISRPTGQHTQH